MAKTTKPTSDADQKKYKDMAIFEACASLFEKQSTKLAYAIGQVKDESGFKDYKKNIAEYQAEFKKQLNKLRVKFASEDKDGQLMYLDKEKGVYSYTKKNAEELTAGIDTLQEKYKPLDEEMDLKPCSFEPYFATSIPAGLTLDHYKAFRGIVISEKDYQKFIAELK